MNILVASLQTRKPRLWDLAEQPACDHRHLPQAVWEIRKTHGARRGGSFASLVLADAALRRRCLWVDVRSEESSRVQRSPGLLFADAQRSTWRVWRAAACVCMEECTESSAGPAHWGKPSRSREVWAHPGGERPGRTPEAGRGPGLRLRQGSAPRALCPDEVRGRDSLHSVGAGVRGWEQMPGRAVPSPGLWDASVRNRLLPAAHPILLKFSRAHSIGNHLLLTPSVDTLLSYLPR